MTTPYILQKRWRPNMAYWVRPALVGMIVAMVAIAIWLASLVFVWAADMPRGPFLGGPQYYPFGHSGDDKYKNAPLHSWFDSLKSGKGLCCSFADGMSIADVDWDTASVASADGHNEIHYRVRIDGHWIVVPPDAVVTVPNKYGPAVVWPYQGSDGTTQVRCFMPGSGA